MTGENCIICADRAIHNREIARTELSFSFPSNMPILPGHVLVCPARHVAVFEELTNAERRDLWDMVSRIQRTLAVAFHASGVNIAWNEGSLAGQSIGHLHIHVVPRRAGDAGITEYEPRQFLYRPGTRETSPEKELVVVADTLREAYLKV